MVIASLVCLRMRGSLQCQLPALPSAPPFAGDDSDDSDDTVALRRGDYAVIRALLRVVDGGKDAKLLVDEVPPRSYRRNCHLSCFAGY
jgi:hypothetical protein